MEGNPENTAAPRLAVIPRKRKLTVKAHGNRKVPSSMGPRFRGDDDEKEAGAIKGYERSQIV
ncbi:hypothetical protein SAMN05444678_11550 [Sphingomonas sp. YR710]|nr:hypothetical protein SAMN05444678_11550 [Sphingomonas sp. YR710]